MKQFFEPLTITTHALSTHLTNFPGLLIALSATAQFLFVFTLYFLIATTRTGRCLTNEPDKTSTYYQNILGRHRYYKNWMWATLIPAILLTEIVVTGRYHIGTIAVVHWIFDALFILVIISNSFIIKPSTKWPPSWFPMNTPSFHYWAGKSSKVLFIASLVTGLILWFPLYTRFLHALF